MNSFLLTPQNRRECQADEGISHARTAHILRIQENRPF